MSRLFEIANEARKLVEELTSVEAVTDESWARANYIAGELDEMCREDDARIAERYAIHPQPPEFP